MTNRSESRRLIASVCLSFVLLTALGIAQPGPLSETPTANGTSGEKVSSNKATTNSVANAASSTRPSDGEIAAAKAAGKVWVNTDTGIYHKAGRWYGTTKTGRFMTEREAVAAGYKEGKR